MESPRNNDLITSFHSCFPLLQRDKLDAHPLFERISDEELESDPAAGLLTQGTEEGQKVGPFALCAAQLDELELLLNGREEAWLGCWVWKRGASLTFIRIQQQQQQQLSGWRQEWEPASVLQYVL